MKWDTFENRLRITGELVAVTGVRVGMSAESAMPTATDLPVIKDANGRPFIPGSSLRGAVRAHIERIVRAFEPSVGNGKGASNPTNTDEWAIPPRRRRQLANRDDYESAVFTESCRVERVFGSPWIASRVRFTDLPLLTEGAEPELRDSVAIDREKESVANKYDFEAMPAGVRFGLEIVAENLDDARTRTAVAGRPRAGARQHPHRRVQRARTGRCPARKCALRMGRPQLATGVPCGQHNATRRSSVGQRETAGVV
jgi:CRISPR-associated RAMP protein (TIGR02581 family)